MEKGREAFNNYLNYEKDNQDFIERISDKFVNGNPPNTFEGMEKFCDDEFQREFLKTIGILIAYLVDSAWKVDEWNWYYKNGYGKRTVATAPTKQHDWVKNLIKYRKNLIKYRNSKKQSIEDLAPSAKYAIRYMQDPSKNLSVLSKDDRKSIAKQILNIEYDEESFDEKVLDCFKDYTEKVVKKDNIGKLCGGILYNEKIKPLWEEIKPLRFWIDCLR